MVEYKYVNKKLIGGKTKRIYEKQGSKKQYLKNNGKMMRVTEYRKKVSNKKKGGAFFSIDGTIKDLKRIEIGTYRGMPLAGGVGNKKRSLQIVLKNENGNSIKSDDFVGIIEFTKWNKISDFDYSFNIALVIFKKNDKIEDNTLLKDAIYVQQAYQKFDTFLTYEDFPYSSVPNTDNVSNEITENGVEYGVCTTKTVNYNKNAKNIDAIDNISQLNIREEYKTNLKNKLNKLEKKDYKAFLIEDISFSVKYCAQFKKMFANNSTKENIILPMLPTMATSATTKFKTPFLKVMVPSIWYSIPSKQQNNSETIISHIFNDLFVKSKAKYYEHKHFRQHYRIFLTGLGMAGARIYSFNPAVAIVFGTIITGLYAHALIKDTNARKKFEKHFNRGDEFNNVSSYSLLSGKDQLGVLSQQPKQKIMQRPLQPQPQPQRVPQQQPQQQSLQRVPQQQPPRVPQQQPPRAQSLPLQQLSRAPLQQLSRAQSLQQIPRAPLQQIPRAQSLQQPLRVQSLQQQFRPQQHFIRSQLGGKLKNKKKAKKKQKK